VLFIHDFPVVFLQALFFAGKLKEGLFKG